MTDPILVAIDGREASWNALDFALDRAHDSETGLHVVHVSSGIEKMERQLKDRIESQVSSHSNGGGVVVNTTFLPSYEDSGRPSDKIVQRLRNYLEDTSTNYQYLVLGNEDNTRMRKAIVGSVAETMIEEREIPVLLVP